MNPPPRRRAAYRPSPIGAHIPSGGGLTRTAVPYARAVGAEAVQIFAGNPRAWARAEGNHEHDAAFHEACTAGGIAVFVHAPYLVNLGSPNPVTRERSRAVMTTTLGRARALGAEGVVMHAGSAVDTAGRTESLGHVREAVLALLDAALSEDSASGARPAPRLLIEPTAGGGGSLAATVEQVGEYFAALDGDERLGLCLDTCHAFAAGADVARPGGVRRLLTSLVRTVGRGRLGLVHANDSRDPVGSGRDRHARIGHGCIGEQPFGELFVHPAMRGVPIVVETPGGQSAHAEDIALLRRLRDLPR